MSAKAHRRFRGRRASIPVAPRVYGTTSVGITSKEVSPLCSSGGIHRAQVHLCTPAQFRELSAPHGGLSDS